MHYIELFYLLSVLFYLVIFPGVFLLGTSLDSGTKKAMYPLIFPISMGFNSILFWILYLIGIYNRLAIVIICFLYALLFYLLFRRGSFQRLKCEECCPEVETHFLKKGFVLFLPVILFFIYYGLLAITTAFTSWDAIAVWNLWAVQMAKLVFVGNTYHYSYPQLMPSILSVIYKMNFFDNNMFLNNAEYVNHFYTILFSIISCWILYNYAKLKNINPIIPVLVLLSNCTYVMWLNAGYCDILPGIFIISFFYLMDIYGERKKNIDEAKNNSIILIVLSLLASSAAFCKQPALLLLPFFFLWILCKFIYKRVISLKLLFIILIPVILISTCYVREIALFKNGVIGTLTYLHSLNNPASYNNAYAAYEGDNSKQLKTVNFFTKLKLRFHEYSAGFIHTKRKSKENIAILIVKILIILSLLYGVINHKERFKTVFLLSLVFLWVSFFGYGLRHMLMIYPVLSLLISVFLWKISDLKSLRNYLRPTILFGLLIMFMINNPVIFKKSKWSNINPCVFNMDREKKLEKDFAIEAGLISVMKHDKLYVEGNKPYAHILSFVSNPDCRFVGFSCPFDSPPAEMEKGDYFFTVRDSLDKQFKELLLVGQNQGWYIYKKQ